MTTIAAVQLEITFPDTKYSCSNHSPKGIAEADKKGIGIESPKPKTKRFTPSEMERLQEAKTFIIKHLHQDLSFKQLEKISAMNRNKLNEGFQLLFGLKLMPFITKARMKTAAYFLKKTDKPIKEIASLTGYKHPKNFLTAYKRHFGTSPGKERE